MTGPYSPEAGDTSGAPQGFAARRAAASRRLSSSQKSKASVPAYLRFVNRKLGGQLAAIAFGLGLTPTQVTVLSSVSSFVGIVVLATTAPGFLVGVAVALLLALGYALDSADGQLARVRGGGTRAGEWLDHVADVAKISALHGAVVLSALAGGATPSRLWILVPVVFLVANVTMFFGLMLRDQMLSGAGAAAERVEGPDPVLKSVALLPIDHGTLCWVFVLLGSTTAFRTAYSLLAVATAVFAARSLTRAYRAVARLDDAPARAPHRVP